MALFTGFNTINRNQNNNKLIDLELVKRDLLNNFYTRRGERVMYPNFGSIIWDMLFDPLTESNLDIISEDVNRIINNEPRVTLNTTNIRETEFGIEINIELTFTPLNAVDTLTLTFDRRTLERGT